MSAQMHRAINKLSAVSILMAQYDPKNKRAWSLVGRLAADIRGELLNRNLPVIGDHALFLLDDITATQRTRALEAPDRMASSDKRANLRRVGT